MTLLAPFGLLAGLLAIPIVLLHVLAPFRERQDVSSTYVWEELREPVSASQPWQRLRPSWLLFLQLLLVALLAFALARPARVESAPLAEHTVFIVDASASMRATDGRPDRLATARDRVMSLRDGLPNGGVASVVVASAEPRVLLSETSDRDLLADALDSIRASAGQADFDAAFALAEGLASPDRATGWILVSDGGLTVDEQRLAPPGTRFEPVGDTDVNRAITSLSITSEAGSLTAIVTMANKGGPASTQDLRIDVDGTTVDSRTVELPAGETVDVAVEIPPGEVVEAFLDGEDLLVLDNSRAVVTPVAQRPSVRIETVDPLGAFFIEQLLVSAGVEIVSEVGADVDLVVYDRVPVPADAPDPFISIASPQPPLDLAVVGEVATPVPTFLADDPLLERVDVTGVAIAAAQRLQVGSGEVLIGGAEGEPLLVRGRSGEVGWFHLAFELEQSNLPLAVAYPIVFARMVDSLSLADDVVASVEVGFRPAPLPHAVSVTSPLGVVQAVAAGATMPVVDRPGIWHFESDDGTVSSFAAVVPSAESDLAVPNGLDALAPEPPGSTAPAPRNTRELDDVVRWILAAAFVVLLAELWLSRRPLAVPSRQWWIGAAVHTAVAALVVAALADVRLSRANDDVRAVVVLDVTDSLRPEGRAAAEQFLADVLAAHDPRDVAVVEVGRTASLVRPFGSDGDDTVGARPTPDGTSLARGVRLAASLLDGSTRQRVVVISDGRNNIGDLSDATAELVVAGVQVDVRTIEVPIGTDVAVARLTGPPSVGEDSSFQLSAMVTAEQAGSRVVELLRDDEILETRQVDLVAGDNDVVFDVAATTPQVDRYEVRLADAVDDIPHNDRAYLAVRVDGPPRVLVLDGATDAGDAIEAALTSRAVDATRRPLTEFPTPEELAGFASVVLVDVDERTLSDDQVDALGTAVREHSVGLVVVGGDQSFALGGYGGSALEELLPIESRTEDPEREVTIAEVLLIDSSESMGACHCRPAEGATVGADPGDPFSGNVMVEGGVNKTDISRAAAARAIDALSGNDEVGVLAFNGAQDWVIPLQPLPSEQSVDEALGSLRPFGETRITPALRAAAEGLRASSKELKHIILFTDGFTPELFDESGPRMGPGAFGEAGFDDLEDLAADLAGEGITVSVVATGEGAAPLLRAVAEAGNGRFYPGRDLEEIPEIFVEEARIATRSFINEGEFVPVVTSTAAPVRGLDSAPALAGYIAATAKPTADVMLQVGAFADPLLASWRIGLGRVTTWTSDGGDRWAAGWNEWEGWADFWSTTVRDTFPLAGAEGRQLSAHVDDGSLVVTFDSEQPWPAGIAPTGLVSMPDGTDVPIELERVSDTQFSATVPAPQVGSYAVGATFTDTGGGTAAASAIATQSYPAEYLPSAPGTALADLSATTGGRGEITADQALDPEGLEAGQTSASLRPWLLAAAALLWPIAVAIRRLRLRRSIAGRRRQRANLLPA